MTEDEIERGLVAQGVPREKARLVAGRALVDGNPLAKPPAGVIDARGLRTRTIAAGSGVHATATLGPAEWPIRAARWLNGFRCTIAAAPRTKKNHTTLGIRQSPAYRQYRDIIVNGFVPLALGLDLPLEDRPYNLAATFYVDRFGERADLIGLIQGLADALQNAGVVSDDRLFLSLDGCRVIAGDPAPRVDVLITELERR